MMWIRMNIGFTKINYFFYSEHEIIFMYSILVSNGIDKAQKTPR